eukprot:366490-Chlamydomonas_euryale.AAC.9
MAPRQECERATRHAYKSMQVPQGMPRGKPSGPGQRADSKAKFCPLRRSMRSELGPKSQQPIHQLLPCRPPSCATYYQAPQCSTPAPTA